MLRTICGLALLLPLASAWVSPAAFTGRSSTVPALRTAQGPLLGISSSFLGAVAVKDEEMVAAARGRSTYVSPVMMGRAAAKRAVTKGKTDMAKTKLNSRYGKMVTMCVKEGGPDLISNPKLGKLIDLAKKAGVPVANMENIIKKASTSKDLADFKEFQYEVYGHAGIGFVIDIVTDNNNRAAGDIRTVLNKQKLKMAEVGSVAFNFDHIGCVTVETSKDEDTVTEAVLEAGGDDLERIDLEAEPDAKAGFKVFTQMTELMSVADSLKEQGYEVIDAKFIWKPKAPIEVSEEDENKNFDAMEAMEELGDVDAVWHNMA